MTNHQIVTCVCGQKNRVPLNLRWPKGARCGKCKAALLVGGNDPAWVPNSDLEIDEHEQ